MGGGEKGKCRNLFRLRRLIIGRSECTVVERFWAGVLTLPPGLANLISKA